MKANLKGRGGIKGLMLLHGEKIAMVLVGALALFFVYRSLSLPSLDDQFQATKLQEQINQTKSVVADAKWPEPDSELASNVRISKRVTKEVSIAVNPDDYENPDAKQGWRRPVIASTTLRTDPQLLNAVDVIALGGSGLFAFIDENIRKQQELRMRREMEEKAQKERERMLKEQQDAAEGRGQPGRRGQGEMERGFEMIDPDRPNLRMVEGMARPTGVPLQGGERIERVYWATVLAKVPIREQLKLYQDAFENARGGFDPQTDFPRYAGYIVQRAEVVRGKPLEWKMVDVYDGQGKMVGRGVTGTVLAKLYERINEEWAGQLPDVVDERYLDFDRILALPLPPLVGRDWGADATHPDIPLMENAPPPEEEPEVTEEDAKEKPIDPDSEPDFSSTDPNLGTGTGPYGGPGGGMSREGYSPYGGRGGGGRYGGMGPDMMMERGGGFYGGGRYGGGGGRYGGGEMGGGRGPGFGGFGGATRGTLPRGIDFWLLRFFDFTVEPGKKYKYRVKLVLFDPNQEPRLRPGDLDPAVHTRLRQERDAAKAAAKAKGTTPKYPDYRMVAEWSEPTPTIGIPLAGTVRVIEAKLPPEDKFNDEPSVELLIEAFDVDDANNWIQAAKERTLRRGSVANFVDDAEYLVDGGRAIDLRESFSFQTGITLLDVDGGEGLAKDLQSPARVMLMDPAGELYIRSEMDDKPAVEYHRLLFMKPDRRRGRGGEEDMRGFGPMMEGGGRYGGGREGR